MALKPKQRAFLAAYNRLASVSLAAKVAKIARRSHYYWLDTREYVDARDEAVDRLEMEARRRGVDGVEAPIYYGGEPVYENKLDPKTGEVAIKLATRRKYSDTLLMFLLKAARPEKYRDNWKPRLPLASAMPPRVEVVFVSGVEQRQPCAMSAKTEKDIDRTGER